MLDSIARFYINDKKNEDAEKYITKILNQNPKYFPARILKGELLISKHQTDEAITIFKQLIKEDPRSDSDHYYKGVAHLGKGKIRIAKRALATAVELNPRFIKAKLLLAETYLREHDFDMAQKESQEVLKIDPEN